MFLLHHAGFQANLHPAAQVILWYLLLFQDLAHDRKQQEESMNVNFNFIY